MKSFSSLSDAVKTVDRHDPGWEKLFANHRSGRGLGPRTYRGGIKLNSKKHPIRKWAKDVDPHFTRGGTRVADQREKSTESSVVREMQIKATMGPHHTPAKVATINKQTNKNPVITASAGRMPQNGVSSVAGGAQHGAAVGESLVLSSET